jgi:hypothetical protein
MELKSLFDSQAKQEILARLEKIGPDTQHVWGKMNAAQMLTHCNRAIGVALGTFQLHPNWFMKTMGPMFKSVLYSPKPFGHGSPTASEFKTANVDSNFAEEKTKLVNAINRYSIENIVDKKHPIFGTFTDEQWGKSQWKHLDHHFRQFGV